MSNIPNSLCSNTICAGLELEYEEVSHKATYAALAKVYKPDDILWMVKSDGSLRPRDCNTELIFIRPLSGKSIFTAIDQLNALSSLKYRISWRCGMHVHVDHRGSSMKEAYKELVLACLLETALFGWAGYGRMESKFCSPITDVYAHIWDAGLATRKNPRFTPSKYVSLNLVPLTNFGSVELRCADSTQDTLRMLEYINIGFGIRLLSETFDTSLDMIDSLLTRTSIESWLSEFAPTELAQALSPYGQESKYISSSSAQAAMFLAEREEYLPSIII